MALRDQPYLPLYVQDLLTDEKLMECSASACGVYMFMLCVLHKQEEYGVILLKQKDKQKDKQISNFALKLLKPLPFDLLTIESAITELLEEKVIYIDGDRLMQKRMVKDGIISDKRSLAGKEGGKSTQSKSLKTGNFAKAKIEANSEYVIEFDNKDVDIVKKQEKLFDEILKFFKYDGINFKQQQSLAFSFVFSLPHHQRLDFAMQQIPAYIELKTLDKYPHGFNKFLGNQSDQFKDGLWNDNWIEKLKSYKIKEGIIQPLSIKKKETTLEKHARRLREQEDAKKNS